MVCWRDGVCTADTNRINKLIKKASSIIKTEMTKLSRSINRG